MGLARYLLFFLFAHFFAALAARLCFFFFSLRFCSFALLHPPCNFADGGDVSGVGAYSTRALK